MTVLVCGGRNLTDRQMVYRNLDRIHAETQITRVIQGGATGADYLARRWCVLNQVRCDTFQAQWEAHGKAAGPMRNQLMLEERPELVVAFVGGNGTADMVRRARKAGVRVIEVA